MPVKLGLLWQFDFVCFASLFIQDKLGWTLVSVYKAAVDICIQAKLFRISFHIIYKYIEMEFIRTLN